MEFDSTLKSRLFDSLKDVSYIRYLRWFSNQSYLRFRIGNHSLKVIVSPLCKTTENTPVYFNYYDEYWVINATQDFNSIKEIVDTIWNMVCYIESYGSDEALGKMEVFALKHHINPVNLDHNCVKKGDDWYRIYFTPESNQQYGEMAIDLAHKYMKYLKLEDDKFQSLFHVMRFLAFDSMGDIIISHSQSSLSNPTVSASL